MTDSETSVEAPSGPASRNERQFFGHPWGLANLFGVELWERFSFYGMQALLAYYIYYSVTDGGLGMSKDAAASIVGAYGGMVYMAALVASFVSDRLLGAERTLLYSAVCVMCGHIFLAVLPGVTGLSLGLVCVALGSGGIKTCAQVVLGSMYSRTDTRRDAGFSIFYLGINIGALIGPIMTNWVWGISNFHFGFGLAAIGMAAGLIQYLVMRESVLQAAGRTVPNPLPRNKYMQWAGIAVGVVVLVVILIATGVIRVGMLSTLTAIIALVASVIMWMQMYRSPLTSAVERRRLVGFIPMFVASALFFGIFQQQFTVLAFYSDFRLNRVVFGMEVKPGVINAINPVFIIIFSTLFAYMWTKLGDRQWSTPVKFGVATLIIGASLFFFLPYSGAGDNSVPLYVIVWILFLFTMAELLLSPVGNSLATKLAPAAFPSQMFALWLMAVSIGTSLAGILGQVYNPDDAAAERSFFLIIGIVTIVFGVLLLVAKKWILTRFEGVR